MWCIYFVLTSNNVLSSMNVQTCLDHVKKEMTQYFPYVENCLPSGYDENSNTGNSRLLSKTLYNGLINVEVNVICWNNLSCTNSFLIILSSREKKICTGTVLLSCYSLLGSLKNVCLKISVLVLALICFSLWDEGSKQCEWKIMYLLTRKKVFS